MQSTVSESTDVSSLNRRLKATPIATKSGYLTKQVRLPFKIRLEIVFLSFFWALSVPFSIGVQVY